MNDQLNYNFHLCNCTNQYVCYFNNFIFAMIELQTTVFVVEFTIHVYKYSSVL